MILQIRFGRVVYAWISVASIVGGNTSLIQHYELRLRPGVELKRSSSNWASYRPKLGSRSGVGIDRVIFVYVLNTLHTL